MSYLKGREVGGRQNFDAFRQAVAYFEDAVAKQPDFALAHAAMAQAQLQFLFGGPLSPRETIPKAEAAARKALQLDDTLAQAHRSLGAILHNFYWRWEDGDKEYARARELSASSDEINPPRPRPSSGPVASSRPLPKPSVRANWIRSRSAPT